MHGVGDRSTVSTLVSPWLKIDEDSCVGFTYKKHRSILKVSLLYKDETSADLITIAGEVDEFWRTYNVDVPKDSRLVQLAFKIISTSFGNYFSLDHIDVNTGNCSKGREVHYVISLSFCNSLLPTFVHV